MAIMPRSLRGRLFAVGGKFCHRSTRCGFGGLAAGVGIYTGVDHQNIDIAAGREHMIQPAVADIIRPAVAADDPDALFHQHIRQPEKLFGCRIFGIFKFLFQFSHACALCLNAGFFGLVSIEEFIHQLAANSFRLAFDQFAGEFALLVHGQAHAQTELGVIFEQRVGPGRSAAISIEGLGRGGQIAAVNGRAAGGIGDNGAVAEELGEQPDVRCFAAAGAGAGELKQRAQQCGVLDRVGYKLWCGQDRAG